MKYDDLANKVSQDKLLNTGFYVKEVIHILNNLGFEYMSFYIKPYKLQLIHQDNVIVFIKRSNKYPFGHYLARYHNVWMDPCINLVDLDNIDNAKSGFRRNLPDRPIYGIIPKSL